MSYSVADRPLAAKGLTSYRCRNRYGWTMIGAKDVEDAMREARRSAEDARRSDLQVWKEKPRRDDRGFGSVGSV